MRHRLEHRHFDQATVARLHTLVQGGEHAVSAVKAGDRVGERGADDARVGGVDEQPQETARGLCDGVERGPIAIGAGRAEARDRQID